ncbi:hypothetical protein ATANTOWER_030495 [Ataeniobius toweri]|uniref:Symplekin C-terminal domain-containing protein n=1 Tax=Ataeniobius toweri TaxID=208326 RepID=A0ABU7ACQ6_9TELE|nr:hypothetical protein [Ataeniobius toweri]
MLRMTTRYLKTQNLFIQNQLRCQVSSDKQGDLIVGCSLDLSCLVDDPNHTEMEEDRTDWMMAVEQMTSSSCGRLNFLSCLRKDSLCWTFSRTVTLCEDHLRFGEMVVSRNQKWSTADSVVEDGLEQSKAREDEGGKEDQTEDDSAAKDVLIKRKLSTVMMGQAISVVGGYTEKPPTTEAPAVKRLPEPILPSAQTKMTGASGRKKVFRLGDVVQPLSDSQIGILSSKAVKRILHSEKAITQSGMSHVRVKLLSRLVTQFEGMMKEEVLEYILEDIRTRSDLAFSLLYQEYNTYLGQLPAGLLDSYDHCLYTLLSGLQEKPEQRDGLFTKLVLEAPIITESALEVIRRYCEDESRVYLGMTTLKELIIKRPSRQFQYLHVLLDLSSHEKEKVRSTALAFLKRMYEKDHLRDYIEKFALNYLQLLVHPNPPSLLFGADKDTEVAAPWTEDTVRQCLFLYLSLLPLNHRLVHELASVYTEAIADIKRSVLRAIEQPIRGMGMNSPELLLLVENCPKGAETLVTRCLHILTDKVPPSPELVERVRDLYHKRVPDVRFLIPVINGLEKSEVIQALPKLIKLNPIVVKEVFNRLLGTQHSEGSSSVSPLTPGDLLIALHNIDSTKCDMKSIIKATNLCFGEKNVYTSEVLAVVMQQLMEQNPLPMLLMRTVIQSLTMYPRLGGFVMNILSRLIVKQVWKYPKVWEGFVKCCQRTKPQSYSVLLQLPPAQLTSVFERCPEMRASLLQHVLSFTPHQQAHIPTSVMVVLEANKKPEPKPVEPVMEKEFEPAPAAEEPSVMESIEPKPPLQQEPILLKDEEEPMEQEEAEHPPLAETLDSISQEDLTKDAEEPTPPPEPAEEPMEEPQPEPSDQPESLKDPESNMAAPEAGKAFLNDHLQLDWLPVLKPLWSCPVGRFHVNT